MTTFGGAALHGTFFKIMPDGTGYVKLSDLDGAFDGKDPVSSLYSDGTFFYGTTRRGGSANLGTIFKIKPDGSGLTKLLDFGVGTNGRYPEGSFSSDGTYLYGTTSQGGTNNYGSLFKIKPNGTGYSTVLNFDNSVYGSGPVGTPLLVDGFLYGLTFVGGTNLEGTIYKIKTDGTNYKKVYEFSKTATGNYPEGNSLITDGKYFYGMLNNGGLAQGTVFRLKDIPENTTILNFTGVATGDTPTYVKLTCDGTTLYGTTSRGGTNDAGVVFKVSSDGASFTKLYDFGAAPDGERPFGSLLKQGTVLYGMTIRGGTTGDGTIFKINTDGSGYSKLFDFTAASTGSDPSGAVVSDGTYLYGVNSSGGTAGRGTIFKILPDGTGFVKLHDFAANSGYPPAEPILIGTTLYGTTFYGGAANEGTIYKIETNGTGFTSIHDFIFPSGLRPYGGALVYDGTYLYGMTEVGGTTDDGVIFKMKPDGTGYADIKNFQAPNGGIPLGGLERVGSALYGFTYEGGADDLGTLFKINSDGSGYETLMEFDGLANGYELLGTPCYCGDALYGTTTSGGTDYVGTIFKYVLPAVAPAIPTITSFTPASGQIGTTVTITGTNFDSNPANNTVHFGATKAIVTAATSTQLTVTVPTGATYEPISVLVNSLIGYSNKPFVVTFPDGGVINSCSFDPKVDFTSGSGPFLISIGDFDGDGKPDLAATNYSSNTVSVYRNTSSGAGNINFATKVDFTTGNSPLSVAAADVDADGKLDLVVTNSGLGTTVSVFRNTSTGPGNINFDARVNFTTGANPNFVSAGDLDKDGKPDLAVVNFSSGTLSIFLNTSTGPGNVNFATKLDFTTGQQPNAVAIGDFDKDDMADVAVVNLGDSDVSIFRNLSTGPGSINFDTRVDFATGNTPRYISIGDLDGDDKPDFAVANDDVGPTTIYRNSSSATGNINFSAQPYALAGSGPRVVSMGDVDGDSKPDMVVSNQNDNNVSAFKNLSTSGSISFSTKVDFGVGARPFTVSIGDFDGDGKADLAATNFNGTSLSVLRNTIVVPSITSFTPTTDVAGAAVTITGTNFDTTPANNIVSFNGTAAVVTASTATSITTTVPVGATTGAITVTVACNTATSATNFTVTTVTPIISISVDAASQANGSTVSYSSLAIGNNALKNFVIGNSGTATLSITDIQVTGDFAIVGAAPTSIPPAQNDLVSIQFSPTVLGARTGTVTFLSNGDIPSYVINLSGVGVDAAPVIEIVAGGVGQGNGSDLGFSSTSIGSEELKDLLITNSGSSTLTITDIQVTGDFSLQGAIPASIEPASGATITIRFTPTELGARTGTLTISSNGNPSVFVINLIGEGGTEIEVYNVVTTNPNGKHDFLNIRNITFFPGNTVSIFDRWGNKVFEVNGYDNATRVFKGSNDKGRDLPEGTYYYVINKSNGDKPLTGFLLLRK
jgi:gliding motility-associated-like protein